MIKYILLLLSVSCFGQFNPTTWYEFGSRNYEPNTFIGGIGGTINTPALLAAKLGVSVDRIRKFKIVGSDVSCAVTSSYSGTFEAFNVDNSITYYADSLGLVKNMNYRFIRRGNNLLWVYFPDLETISDETFILAPLLNSVKIPKLKYATGQFSCLHGLPILTELVIPEALEIFHTNDSFCSNNTSLTTLDIRKLTKLGSTQRRDGNILQNSNLSNLIIYANSALQTSNAGGVEGDLAFAISGGATVIWVTP